MPRRPAIRPRGAAPARPRPRAGRHRPPERPRGPEQRGYRGSSVACPRCLNSARFLYYLSRTVLTVNGPVALERRLPLPALPPRPVSPGPRPRPDRRPPQPRHPAAGGPGRQPGPFQAGRGRAPPPGRAPGLGLHVLPPCLLFLTPAETAARDSAGADFFPGPGCAPSWTATSLVICLPLVSISRAPVGGRS
jgi:hypothetical protein